MILVTGGTGMVGGHLLWHLLQTNDRVVALKRKASNLNPLKTIFGFYTKTPENFLEKIEWRDADLLDVESLKAVFKNVDTVYHCAAVVDLGQGANSMMDTNVAGTRNIVGLALENKVEKFCYVSSIAACGSDAVVDETTEWSDHEQRTLYSRSKYYAEAEVWKGISLGLNAVIVNPGVILGVSGTETGSSQLFARVRKGLMFYTNGGSGYVDVQDVVRVMLSLMSVRAFGERFILVSENCSNQDILSWMADGFGRKRPKFGVGRKTLLAVGTSLQFLGELFHFKPLLDVSMARSATNREFYSSTKLETLLNYKFRPVRESIMEICAYISDN